MDKKIILNQIKHKEEKLNQLKSSIENVNLEKMIDGHLSSNKTENTVITSYWDNDRYHKLYNDLLNFVAFNLWNPEKKFAEKNLIEFSELSDNLKSDINLISLALCIDTKNYYQIPEAIREKAITNLIIGINKYGESRYLGDSLEKEYLLKQTILSNYFDPFSDGQDNDHICGVLEMLFVDNVPPFDLAEHKKLFFILLKEFDDWHWDGGDLLTSALGALNQSLLDDENFVLEVLNCFNNYGIPIAYASERLKKDKSFALRVCAKDGTNLIDFDPKFLKDRDVVITALLNYPKIYHVIDRQLQQDDLIYDLAIKNPSLDDYELKKIKMLKADISS